jgi:CRP-like cAMP-binding protein
MLEPAETVAIFQKQPNGEVPAGQIIFEQGQPGDYMYGILEGEVELSIDGKVVELIKAGDVFGEGALAHPNGSRFTTARAKTDCKLARLDQQHFLFVVQENPLFALQVIRSYSDRLRQLKAHIA